MNHFASFALVGVIQVTLFAFHGEANAQAAESLTSPTTQTQAVPKTTWSRESPPMEDSYAARNFNRRQVHPVDPNIWAYSAEFAERFKMPKEWVASDLQGAEAVAFRIEPAYRSCGWGGNPDACRDNETRCVMDVYFDNKKQPLPWEKKIRESDLNLISTSAFFIGTKTNQFARYPGKFGKRFPFSDPNTGNELYWSVEALGSSSGALIQFSYDREVFAGLSFVTLRTYCGDDVKMTLKVFFPENATEKSVVYNTVVFPQSWRLRKKSAIQENNAKTEAFFKKTFEELKKKEIEK